MIRTSNVCPCLVVDPAVAARHMGALPQGTQAAAHEVTNHHRAGQPGVAKMADPIQSTLCPGLQHLLCRPHGLPACASFGPLQALPRAVSSNIAPMLSPADPLVLKGQRDEGLKPAIAPPLKRTRTDYTVGAVRAEKEEIAKEVQVWGDSQKHFAEMGEGGEDHNGVRDEVCKMDPVITEHVFEELGKWRCQARREERGEEHYLARSRLRHAGVAALSQYQHVRTQVLHNLEHVAPHPRLRETRHLSVWGERE